MPLKSQSLFDHHKPGRDRRSVTVTLVHLTRGLPRPQSPPHWGRVAKSSKADNRLLGRSKIFANGYAIYSTQIDAMTGSLNDYYVLMSRRGDNPERWSWEMRRKSKPLGVKLTADGFQSDASAQFAGKIALEDFLNDLSKEERRIRK